MLVYINELMYELRYDDFFCKMKTIDMRINLHTQKRVLKIILLFIFFTDVYDINKIIEHFTNINEECSVLNANNIELTLYAKHNKIDPDKIFNNITDLFKDL